MPDGYTARPTWKTNRVTVPYYDDSFFSYQSHRNRLVYLAGDVDVSWLHDFSPHFGFELGVKVGLAGRLAGRVGGDYPREIMFGRDLYPIFSLYSGLRF